MTQVIRIERVMNHTHPLGRTREIMYGLTSLSSERASPERLLALFREHWKIESGLHYRRDVTLQEDATRFTDEKAAHNMAILNNMVSGLCLSNGFSNLASARRYFDARPRAALDMLVSDLPPTL